MQPPSQSFRAKMQLINVNARAQILWKKCLWFGHEENRLKIKMKFPHTNLLLVSHGLFPIVSFSLGCREVNHWNVTRKTTLSDTEIIYFLNVVCCFFLNPSHSVALYRITTTFVSQNMETIRFYSMFEVKKEKCSKACVKLLIMCNLSF